MNTDKRPIVTVKMKSGGQFSFELFPEWAPNACSSVIKLALAGAYDGLTIDRVVPGFVIQPRYSDEGRPDLDFVLDGEFESNGFSGNPPIVTGIVAMAGNGKDRASGSAFFITLGEHPRLTGHFTAIGKIVDGWDEIKRIEAVDTYPVDNDFGVIINCPVTPEIMEKVSVETYGVTYPDPVILKRLY